MPASLWSGNLRLSLVLIPVKLHSAVSTEDAISFRLIHEPSGQPIRYVKGIPTEAGFEEVPKDEIIRGYEHSKGQHVFTSVPKRLTILSWRRSTLSSLCASWTPPRSTVGTGRSRTISRRMVTTLMKDTPSSVRPEADHEGGHRSDSWEVEAIWSASKRMAKRDLCFPS